jgi:hypothetical protein
MSESIKGTIKNILTDKKSLVISKLHRVEEEILNQLESLKELAGFDTFTIPEGLEPEVSNSQGKDAGDLVEHIHKYTKEISSSVNQLGLINNLLEGINHYCQRSALFLLRDDKLVGWKGRGFTASSGSIRDEEIKKVFFSLSADTVFKKVLNSKESYSGVPNVQSDDHLIYSRFGGDLPKSVFILPFFVKGKPQAVIYADTFTQDSIKSREIEILSTIGEMSMDLLPLKQKILAKVKTQEFLEDPHAQTKAEIPDVAKEKTATELTSEIPFQSIKMNDPARKARVIINDIIMQ